jgi:hypothetical protein
LVSPYFLEGHGAGLVAPASAMGSWIAGLGDVRKRGWWSREEILGRCIRWTLEGRFPAGCLPAFTADLRAFAGEVVAEDGRPCAL